MVVWHRAVDLCIAVYNLTKQFPREETYGLVSQSRRASVSIASNIAEGYGRSSRDQYKQFLAIARGSYPELQTQLLIARKLAFAEASDIQAVSDPASEVGRMLAAILRKLSQPPIPDPQFLLFDRRNRVLILRRIRVHPEIPHVQVDLAWPQNLH